jgi:hypothetical protein
MYLFIGILVLFWAYAIVSQNKPQTSTKPRQSSNGKGLYSSFKKTLNHVKHTGKMPTQKSKKTR